MSLAFEWDPRKARLNLRKHRVRFAEAAPVFGDPLARIFPDEDHAPEESREIIIGHSTGKRLLLVASQSRNRITFGSSALGAPLRSSSTTMKKTSRAKPKTKRADGLRAEYRFDYTKAKPNRFAKRGKTGSLAVLLDPDVAHVFNNAESVNAVLRALVAVMPRRTRPTNR